MYFKAAKGTFFFDQKVIQKRKRRKRRRPDELPKSIRFASLNPKLAAFLANHDRQKTKRFLEGVDVGDGDNGLPILENGGSSFLPNIHADNLLRLLRGSNDNLLYERDVPQRQRYHSAVSAAPTLIVKLSRLLYLFKTEHLDLPGELVNDLQSGFPELISEAKFTRPEWQCLENIPENDEDGEDRNSEDFFDVEGLTGDEAVDEIEEPQENVEKKKKKKKKLTEKGNIETPLIILPKKDGNFPSPIGSRRLTGSAAPDRQRTGRKSILGKDGTTFPRMAFLSRGDDTLSSKTADTPANHGHGHGQGVHQPSFLQVISFSMTLKSCEEKGWIIKQIDKKEEEQRSLFETLVQRLQQSSREAKVAAENAKVKGHIHPFTNRYYGDTKRASLFKYMNHGKKSSARLIGRMPKLPTSTETENRSKFTTSLPDGTSTAFYPSGRMAVTQTNASHGRPGHYTLVYSDNEERTLLAVFTPTGKGSCYHQNGKVRFCATDKGCIVLDQEGTAVKRFNWPLLHSKFEEPVTIPISELLSLKVLNVNQMTLTFECKKEVSRFSVGAHLIAAEPHTQDELGYIETMEEFTSNAAKEAIRPPPPPPSKKNKKGTSKKAAGKGKIPIDQMSEDEINPLAELLNRLEIAEPGKYGIPAERELNRLLRKIKNNLDEWLDHYRLSLSITSPFLQRMPSAPRWRKGSAMSAKSTPGSFPHPASEYADQNQISFELPSKFTSRYSRSVHGAVSGPRNLQSRSATCKSAPPGVDVDLEDSDEEEDDFVSVRYGRVKIDVPGDEGFRKFAGSRAMSRGSRYSFSAKSYATHRAPSTTRTEITEASGDQKGPSPLTGCPIALRAELLGDVMATCKCSRHKIPTISDVELDRFLQKEIPKTQLVVLCVMSSMFPSAMPCGNMLTHLYEKLNKNRTRPCYQSARDPYRLFLYNMATASRGTSKAQPELYHRHNASPGMFMIYGAGKLLFCDHIFNGYGNARRDFQKQLDRSRTDAKERNFLPQDFRFSSVGGRRGPRSAWGGEIGGGTLEDFLTSSALPNLNVRGSGLVRSASASSMGSSRSQSFVMKPWTQTRPHTTAGRKVVSADSLTEFAANQLPHTARPRVVTVT